MSERSSSPAADATGGDQSGGNNPGSAASVDVRAHTAPSQDQDQAATQASAAAPASPRDENEAGSPGPGADPDDGALDAAPATAEDVRTASQPAAADANEDVGSTVIAVSAEETPPHENDENGGGGTMGQPPVPGEVVPQPPDGLASDQSSAAPTASTSLKPATGTAASPSSPSASRVKAVGSVRVRTKSWLASGDLAMWQLPSTKLCTALGCTGVLVLVVVLIAFLFTFGLFMGVRGSNEVKEADPGTLPSGNSAQCGNSLRGNLTQYLLDLRADGLGQVADDAERLLAVCNANCHATVEKQHRTCYNRAVIINRRDFVVTVTTVFVVAMFLFFVATLYKMTCGWRGTAGSALLNKRLVTIIRRRVATAMARQDLPVADGRGGCLARACSKASSALRYYRALGRTTWRVARSGVIKEQFGSKPPSGVVGTLKYLKAMKKVFIDFGGVAWGWKLAAMELLEVVSQSLVLFTSVSVATATPQAIGLNRVLGVVLAVDCIGTPLLAAFGQTNLAVSLDVLAGLGYTLRGGIAVINRIFDGETTTLLHPGDEGYLQQFGNVWGFMLPAALTMLMLRDAYKDVVASRLAARRLTTRRQAVKAALASPPPVTAVLAAHAAGDEAGSVGGGNDTVTPSDVAALPVDNELTVVDFDSQHELDAPAGAVAVPVPTSEDAPAAAVDGAATQSAAGDGPDAVVGGGGASAAAVDDDFDSAEEDVRQSFRNASALSRRELSKQDVLVPVESPCDSFKAMALRPSLRALLLYLTIAYGILLLVGTLTMPLCGDWFTCQYCEPLSKVPAPVVGSWKGNLTFTQESTRQEAPTTLVLSSTSNAEVLKAHMTLEWPGVASGAPAPCAATYSVTCLPRLNSGVTFTDDTPPTAPDVVRMQPIGPLPECLQPSMSNKWWTDSLVTGWAATERIEDGSNALDAAFFDTVVGYVFEAPTGSMTPAVGPGGAVGDAWVMEMPVTAYKRLDQQQTDNARLVLSLVRTAVA